MAFMLKVSCPSCKMREATTVCPDCNIKSCEKCLALYHLEFDAKTGNFTLEADCPYCGHHHLVKDNPINFCYVRCGPCKNWFLLLEKRAVISSPSDGTWTADGKPVKWIIDPSLGNHNPYG